MKTAPLSAILLTVPTIILVCFLFLPGCESADGHVDQHPEEAQPDEAQAGSAQSKPGESEERRETLVRVTSPVRTDVISTQPYTCLIQACKHSEQGDVLSTMSDNDVMWVYFNVPEVRYLEYMASQGTGDPQHSQQLQFPGARIELRLADGSIFNQTASDAVTVGAEFNSRTGNIPFRADFPNPDHLLRPGQTGTILIHRTLKNVVVISQRATFEIFAKRYVYVVDTDNVVHQRGITVGNDQEDIFVIKDGVDEGDRIILEGIRQVRDGEKLENPEFVDPQNILGDLKYHAE